MTARQILRALAHLVGGLVPMRGRDRAVCDAADALASAEAEYEVAEPTTVPPEGVPPATPSGGHLPVITAAELTYRFDAFLLRWVEPKWHGHLLDNDDNDGERMRTAIREALN